MTTRNLRLQALLFVVIPLLITGCSILGFGQKPLCEDPKATAYVQKVGGIYSETQDAFTRLGELLNRLDNDASLLNSSAWKTAVNEQVQIITQNADEVQGMKAPRKEFGVFHELLRNAFKDYSDGAMQLQQGLLDSDAEEIVASLPILLNGDQKMEGAQAELLGIVAACE